MKLHVLFILPLLAFAGCETASNLIFEPAPDDPLDGYEGSLAQAGINTELDFSPQQSTLLGKYKELMERNQKLAEEKAELEAENQNLQAQLQAERNELEKEKSLRAQAEAETASLRSKSRDFQAKILSLSIEKAKLEQERLLHEIAALDAQMRKAEVGATPAAGGQ